KRWRGTVRMAASVRASRTPRCSICSATMASRARSGPPDGVGGGAPQERASAATSGSMASIRLGEIDLARGRLAATDTRRRGRLALDGDDAHGGLRLLLDGRLAPSILAPAGHQEAAALGHHLLELVVAGDARGVVGHEL